MERIGSPLEIIRGAAPVDEDIAALWERIPADFHDTQVIPTAPVRAE